MEKLQDKPKAMLGIDKLWLNLERIRDATQRLKIRGVESIFQQMLQDIPYASAIMLPTLAESLFSDTPQTQSSLMLNEVIVQLGKVLANPALKDELSLAVQTYLQDRKKTEKEYASIILKQIFQEEDLKAFPERVHDAMKTLPLPIIEKVINEKQLRRVPGHKLQSLLLLVEPWLYHRLFNLDLDRVRASHQLAFRRFVNHIAQDAFDSMQDEKMLQTIHREKSDAFEKFKLFLASNLPLPLQFEKFQEKLKICQTDKMHRIQMFEKKLNEFLIPAKLTTNEGILSAQLRNRFLNRMRFLLSEVETNSDIYVSDETVIAAHEDVFYELHHDANAIQNLIKIVSSIWENFAKKILQAIAQASTLKKLEETLLDVLLGKANLKKSFITGETRAIREGGYPQQSVDKLYEQMTAQLSQIFDNSKGLFVDKLRAEISRAISELKAAVVKLEVIERKVAPKPEADIEVEPVRAMPSLEDLVQASLQEAAKEAPKKPEKVAKPVKEEPIEEEPFALEPVVKEEPVKEVEPVEEIEPIVLEPVKTGSEFVSKPLEITEEFEPDVPELTTQAETVIQVEESASTTVKEVHDPIAQAAFDAGLLIMKNYQLGIFEDPIIQAWHKMITVPADAMMGSQEGLLLPSDNEVRLYVICDLAQQVSSIAEDNLSADQKETLQDVKKQILNALENPVDESLWDYFEGTHRDYIDGALSTLL